MTRIFSLLFFIAFSITTSAQTWDWGVRMENNQSKRITKDHFGNIYTIGNFEKDTLVIGSDTLINNGLADVLIVKSDEQGHVKWAKAAGGNNLDFGCAVTTDSKGDVYITGYFFSLSIAFESATLSNTGGGSAQMFVAKYDSEGKVVWVKTYSGNSSSTSWGIKADHSDNILVTGNFLIAPIAFDSVVVQKAGMLVLKLDKNGNTIWAKDGGQMGTDVAIDASNNIFVSGYFNGNTSIGSFQLTNNSVAGYSDLYIVKYDSLGNVLWVKSAGKDGLDMAMSVATDNSGNAYLTGIYGQYMDSPILFGATTLTSTGNGDVFLAKYDPSGNIVWAKKGGGSGEDISNAVATDHLGNTYITGYFTSDQSMFDSESLTNSASDTRDIFIVKYNSSGNVIRVIGIGGSDHDEGMDLAIDKKNDVYFTGTYRSAAIYLGTHLLVNDTVGKFQTCVGKLGSLTGISFFEKQQSQVLAHPSFFRTETLIQFENLLHKNATLSVYNSCGQFIFSIENLTTNKLKIEKGNLSTGLYLMVLTQENQVIGRGKFIIQ